MAYAKTEELPIYEIDLFKVPLTGTQIAELSDLNDTVRYGTLSLPPLAINGKVYGYKLMLAITNIVHLAFKHPILDDHINNH